MLFKLDRTKKKQWVTLLMLWSRMLSSSLPKLSKLRKTKSPLSNHCQKKNKSTISPKLNYTSFFQKVESSSLAASNFPNKRYWQSGKILPRRRTLRREKKLEWSMIHRSSLWSQDGVPIRRRISSNLPLWRKSNSIETPSQIKREREISIRKNKNLKKSKM